MEGLKLVAMESEAPEAHKSEKSSSAVGGKLLNCSHCAMHCLSFDNNYCGPGIPHNTALFCGTLPHNNNCFCGPVES